jgi:hypothetical protein
MSHRFVVFLIFHFVIKCCNLSIQQVRDMGVDGVNIDIEGSLDASDSYLLTELVQNFTT